MQTMHMVNSSSPPSSPSLGNDNEATHVHALSMTLGTMRAHTVMRNMHVAPPSSDPSPPPDVPPHVHALRMTLVSMR